MKTTGFLLFTMLLFIGVANAQTTYEYRYALETPVNIRSGQSSKHDIVGQLKKDERFEMDASCKAGYCKARAGNIEGYVHISQAKREAAKAVEAAEPAKAATAPAKSAEPAKVINRSASNAEESSFEWWMIPVGLLMLIVLWKIKWWIISTIVTALKVVFVEIIGGVMAFLRQNKE